MRLVYSGFNLNSSGGIKTSQQVKVDTPHA